MFLLSLNYLVVILILTSLVDFFFLPLLTPERFKMPKQLKPLHRTKARMLKADGLGTKCG